MHVDFSHVHASQFAWWLWLLIAAGAAVVCGIAVAIANAFGKRNIVVFSYPFGFVGLISGLISMATFFIGVVRLVKWAWK
jgi:hypothetical protein